MRRAVIAGVVGIAMPTLALAQTKVDLGDGVSVIFPSAPVKIHMTVDPPAGTPLAESPPVPARPDSPPLPVPPSPMGFASTLASADQWMLREGGASFSAMAMTPRTPRPVDPLGCGAARIVGPSGAVSTCQVLGSGAIVRELRMPSQDGSLNITRSIERGGRSYSIMFMRMGPERLAKLHSKDQTPPDAAGEDFIASFAVAGSPSK